MFRTTRKTAIALTAAAATATAVSLAAFASPAASAQPSDSLIPPNTSFPVSNSGNITINGTVDSVPITVTCTGVTLTAMTQASGLTADVTASGSPSEPVHFTGCTDNFGGSDTVTTSGSWTLTNNDAGDPATEPQSSGDELVIGIPNGGAVFTTTALPGCTITVDASTLTSSSFNDGSGSGASATSATYSDAGPINVTPNSSCTAGSASLSGIFNSSTSIQDTA